jgi:hypothetical protein
MILLTLDLTTHTIILTTPITVTPGHRNHGNPLVESFTEADASNSKVSLLFLCYFAA